jgi:MYXO-CTERM domain-containing protein
MGSATLDASVTGTNISNLAGGATSTSISVGLTNTTSGVKGGTVAIGLASNGSNSGYADTALIGQTVTVSGTVYDLASAVFSKTSGDGTFTGGGTSYSLNFGTGLALSTTYTATIQLANSVFSNALYQDALSGSYTSSLGGEFGTTASAVSNLAAGGTTSFDITFSTGVDGSFGGFLNLGSLFSQQTGLTDASLANVNIAFTGATVPEPNAAMLVGGLGMLALLRRRRNL